jgi:hypothetical protein
VRGVSGTPLVTRSTPLWAPCKLLQVHSVFRQIPGIILLRLTPVLLLQNSSYL